jgi:hypothetical protein
MALRYLFCYLYIHCSQGCQMVYVHPYQKYPLVNILEGLENQNIGLFYCNWKYFTAYWHCLCSFDIFCVV